MKLNHFISPAYHINTIPKLTLKLLILFQIKIIFEVINIYFSLVKIYIDYDDIKLVIWGIHLKLMNNIGNTFDRRFVQREECH